MDLNNIKKIEKKTSFFSSPKIELKLFDGEHKPLHFIFKNGKRDEFYDELLNQLKKKSWVKEEVVVEKKKFDSKLAGLCTFFTL
jgi:hypothetical protein